MSAKQKSERSKRGVKQVNAPFFSYPLFIFSSALFFYFLFVCLFFLCIFEIFSGTLLRMGVKVAKHPGMLSNSSPGLRLRKNVAFYTKQEFSTTHYIDDRVLFTVFTVISNDGVPFFLNRLSGASIWGREIEANRLLNIFTCCLHTTKISKAENSFEQPRQK